MPIRLIIHLIFSCFLILLVLSPCASASEGVNRIQALKESAQSDPVAARTLGLLLIAGRGVAQDVKAGFSYLERAAKLGDAESARLLLRSYENPDSKYYAPTKAAELREQLGISARSSPENSPQAPHVAPPPVFGKFERWPAESLPNERPKSGGSSFAVNANGVFVTNFHVVSDCGRIVVSYNGMRGIARLIGTQEYEDLAVLKVAGKTPVYLSLRDSPVVLGEPVTVAGYSVGIGQDSASMKLSQGIVARLINQSLLQMSASVSSGNSGGPVVDRSGKLVGVSVGKIPAGQEDRGHFGDDYNFAIRSERLGVLLRDIREDFFLLPKNSLTIETEVMARVLQQATARILCYR